MANLQSQQKNIQTLEKFEHSPLIHERRRNLFPAKDAELDQELGAIQPIQYDTTSSSDMSENEDNLIEDYELVGVVDKDGYSTPISQEKRNLKNYIMSPLFLSPYTNNSPRKFSPSQNLKTPHDSSSKSNLPKLQRELLEESKSGKRTDSTSMESPSQKSLDVRSGKVRTALFSSTTECEPDISVSTKSFYSKSGNKDISDILSTSRDRSLGKITKVVTSRASHHHRFKKQLGQINYGVRHKIRKPKQKKISKAAVDKAAKIMLKHNDAINEYIKDISNLRKKENKTEKLIQNTLKINNDVNAKLDSTEKLTPNSSRIDNKIKTKLDPALKTYLNDLEELNHFGNGYNRQIRRESKQENKENIPVESRKRHLNLGEESEETHRKFFKSSREKYSIRIENISDNLDLTKKNASKTQANIKKESQKESLLGTSDRNKNVVPNMNLNNTNSKTQTQENVSNTTESQKKSFDIINIDIDENEEIVPNMNIDNILSALDDQSPEKTEQIQFQNVEYYFNEKTFNSDLFMNSVNIVNNGVEISQDEVISQQTNQLDFANQLTQNINITNQFNQLVESANQANHNFNSTSAYSENINITNQFNQGSIQFVDSTNQITKNLSNTSTANEYASNINITNQSGVQFIDTAGQQNPNIGNTNVTNQANIQLLDNTDYVAQYFDNSCQLVQVVPTFLTENSQNNPLTVSQGCFYDSGSPMAETLNSSFESTSHGPETPPQNQVTLEAYTSIHASENSIQLHNHILSPISQMCDVTSGLALTDSPKRGRNLNSVLYKMPNARKSENRLLPHSNRIDSNPDNQTTAEMETNKYFPLFYGPMKSSGEKRERNEDRKMPAKKFKALAENQMLLDAGQKKFGYALCNECNLVYHAGDPGDEIAHQNYHSSSHILRFSGWKNERVVADFQKNGRIIKVVPSDSKIWTKKVTDLMEVVNRDLGCYEMKSDISQSEVYLYIKNRTIVGCVVATVPKFGGYRMLSSVEGLSMLCSEESYPIKCGISHIWVALNARKQGVASALIDAVKANFVLGTTLTNDDIALTSPTEAGMAFATKYFKTSNYLIYFGK